MTTSERDAKIRARLRELPEMSAEQLRQQQVGFTYGNVAIDEPNVTRALVELITSMRKR